MKPDVWQQTPPLCKHSIRKQISKTTVASEGGEPRPHILVTPMCGSRDCPIQMYEIKKEH